MRISAKRVYDRPDALDGAGILVDRLWPRGLKKDRAKIDLWLKDIAPTSALRKWFAHDPGGWAAFKDKYFKELDEKADLIGQFLGEAKSGALTLLYAARDERFNNAVALREYIEKYFKNKKQSRENRTGAH